MTIPGLIDTSEDKESAMTKKKILVSGGAGYIGLHLCRQLLEAGFDVEAVDRGLFPSGVKAFESFCPGAKLHVMDMRDITPAFLAGVYGVCHLGGLSNDPTADFDPALNEELNDKATQLVANACKLAGVKRLTFAGSASVYGFNTGKAINETAPTCPQSGYASTKLAAEKHILNAGGVVLRQATVGGWSPRMRWDLVVNTMFRSAMVDGVINVFAGGEASRPLVDVRDVAQAHVLCMLDPEWDEKLSGEIFNVCHDRENSEQGSVGYTVACLALWIKHCLEEHGVTGVEVRGMWDRNEGRSYDVSGAKLKAAIDWSPPTTVADTVAGLFYNWHTINDTDPESRNINWMKMYETTETCIKQAGPLWR